MKKIAAIGLFIILSTNLQGSVFQRNHHITETDGNTRKMVISKAEVNERIRRAVKEAVEKRDEENQGCCKNALLCGCCVGCFSGCFAGMALVTMLLDKQKHNS